MHTKTELNYGQILFENKALGIPATWDSLKPFSSHAAHQCFVLKKNSSIV